ncbi:MAG: hypothetical protein RLZZ08_1264 [Pseudomonadota bacterium]|jgi:hypothetical protein
MPFLSVLMPLLLQATTATPVDETPLEAGHWILRESRERGTGYGGVSASLLSNDGAYRLVVRCDFSYGRDISIQFLRARRGDLITALPAALYRQGSNTAVPLVWEQTPAGVFARDGEDDSEASTAAIALQDYVGGLRVDAMDAANHPIRALFDASAGQGAVRLATSACFQK